MNGRAERKRLITEMLVTLLLWLPGLAHADEPAKNRSELPSDIIRDADGVEQQAMQEHLVVEVASEDPIVQAEAIIVESSQAKSENPPLMKHRTATILGKEAGGWKIRVNLQPGDRTATAKLTVVATTADGRSVASRVTALSDPKVVAGPTESRCQMDSANARLEMLLALDQVRLVRLIEIRKKQKDALTQLLSKTLDEGLFAKLNQLEKDMGLNYSAPLSADMTNEDLAERVGVIHAIISRKDK